MNVIITYKGSHEVKVAVWSPTAIYLFLGCHLLLQLVCLLLQLLNLAHCIFITKLFALLSFVFLTKEMHSNENTGTYKIWSEDDRPCRTQEVTHMCTNKEAETQLWKWRQVTQMFMWTPSKQDDHLWGWKLRWWWWWWSAQGTYTFKHWMWTVTRGLYSLYKKVLALLEVRKREYMQKFLHPPAVNH